MDENPALILVRDHLTDLLLKTVYDDVVEVEYPNGTKGHMFTKFYQGEVIYFNEYALYHLHGTAMARLFEQDGKNIYRSLHKIESAIAQARKAHYALIKSALAATTPVIFDGSSSTTPVIFDGSSPATPVIFDGSSPTTPVIFDGSSSLPKQNLADSIVTYEAITQHYPRAINIAVVDRGKRRHYKLYSAPFINFIIGQARYKNPSALDFLELTSRLLALHYAASEQIKTEAYRMGYEDGVRAAALLQATTLPTGDFQPSQSSSESNPQYLIEVQQQLIETQRELSEAYRKLLQLQKTQLQDPLA